MNISSQNRGTVMKIIVGACAAFLILLIIALITTLVSLSSASSRKEKLQRELSQINAQIEANETNLEYYQSDEYIEMLARKYLDMQGEGEISFVGK